MKRVVVWFSCGAASAVAAKLALEQFRQPEYEVVVVYCDTMKSEHSDNQRFFDDVQDWLEVPILRIASTKFATVQEVWEFRRYMAGIAGAPCTAEMKKVPRFAFQRPDDIHVWGYRADEQARIEQFKQNNPELDCAWVLSERGIDEMGCLRRIQNAGIKLPAMYLIGFKHNNCLGCPKATSSRYWNLTRQHFPHVFEERAKLSRELGARLVRVNGERIFLDELPDGEDDGVMEDISCGPDCVQTRLL